MASDNQKRYDKATVEKKKAIKKFSQASENIYKSAFAWRSKRVADQLGEVLSVLASYSMSSSFTHNAYSYTTSESLRALADLIDAAAKKS